MTTTHRSVSLPAPDMQVEFASCLALARKSFLVEALSETVNKLDIPDIDKQLAVFVGSTQLRDVATVGLRGELVFPVPIILRENPRLLAYYRLLLGYSQKAFYQGRNGTTKFACMESAGNLPKTGDINELCREMIRNISLLVGGIGAHKISRELLDDLTLLTYGPQLRGGANVRKGSLGMTTVFQLVHDIVGSSVKIATERKITLQNAAKRRVVIQFAPDPDIVIQETNSDGTVRNIIAVEVKGGTDFSNIHNRIGEAEKSHQKAHAAGYAECWTIVNVDNIDLVKAVKESPSTNRFFRLSELQKEGSDEYKDFRNRVLGLTGILDKQSGRAKKKPRTTNQTKKI